jgi:hypothetical protein
MRRQAAAQQAIRDKNRTDPFGFGSGDAKKFTDAMTRHSLALEKSLERMGTSNAPGLHSGIGGMFFDDKGGNYVAGAGAMAADAAQRKKDWEDSSRRMETERRAGTRGAGAITAGSSEFFKTLFAASGNQQANRQYQLALKQYKEQKRAADAAVEANRQREQNVIMNAEVR